MTTGTGSYATACRSLLVSPAQSQTVSSVALRLSVAFKMRQMRQFWVSIRRSPATLAMTARVSRTTREVAMTLLIMARTVPPLMT